MAPTDGGAAPAMLQFLLFTHLIVATCSSGQGANLERTPGVPMAVPMPIPAITADSPDQFHGKLRLPRFAMPTHYELHFHPDLVSSTFSGVVSINVFVLAPTRFLVLNVVELTIDHASIHFKHLEPTDVVFFKDDQIMVLGFRKGLPLGEGVLSMHFNGTLSDEMRGFHRGKYHYKGEMAYMAFTVFEPVNARRCFPCCDEPDFKATFKLTLEVQSDLVALSNMPVLGEIVDGSIKVVHFEESPLMSTYLVAMVVGIFEFIEGVTSQGTKVRVYTEVGKSKQGQFALDVGVKSLDLYDDYFETPYALPKLDMIGIPDFPVALENFGLVTIGEGGLLLDETSTTSTKQQEIAVNVAHELAHQWCGNLVTMEWWNDIWLSERFATWMSHEAVDSFFPQWNIWLKFLVGTVETLRLDSMNGSHPIEKALASYVKKYAYSNAKTEDLWIVIEEETGEPLKDLMTPWTKEPGYPVINVKHEGEHIQLEQAQFDLDGSSRSSLWDVPITLRCSSSTEKFILKHKHDKVDFYCKRQKDGNIWIKLNINETGFYRVKYDKEITATLPYALEASEFSSMEKIGILDNALVLSMSYEHRLASLLHIVYACREEADYNVLPHICDITTSVSQITFDATPNLAGDIKQLLIKILLSPTLKLGWDPKDGEGDLLVRLRETLLVALVKLGHDQTINEGVKRFHILKCDHNSSILSPHSRKAAYLSMMKKASSLDRSSYDDLRQFYKDLGDGVEKRRILGVLSSCSDMDIVLESLNLIFTNEVPNQHALDVLNGITIEAREIAWSWLKENWDRILKVVPKKDLWPSIVDDIVPLFNSNDKV
ncbi:unnamed protein product [Triticum turgidum subsp. durum]|uniref:Aminopeptidase n=1 Tax=Triticum turgidum subsp. durum TaxID=4567 RepID=A0A9R0R899_TRITD|nr:unnamed protein product [Triticum turgidum subsp. durum]